MLILFDCDGVLLDSEHLGCTLEAEMLCELGIPIRKEDGLNLFWGKDFEFTRTYALKNFGMQLPDSFFDIFHQREKELFKHQLKAMPGCANLLHSIPNKALVSNGKLAKIENSLALTGLKSFFPIKHIFHVDLVNAGKPAPDLYLLAAQKMNYKLEDCVVIEDSISGVQAAIAAGMRVYGFTGGTHVQDKNKHAQVLLDSGAQRIFETMESLSLFFVKGTQ